MTPQALFGFRLELLWTDVLVWLLVAAIIGYAVYARARPHLRAPWSRVSRSASGMAAAVILAAFVLVTAAAGRQGRLCHRNPQPAGPCRRTTAREA